MVQTINNLGIPTMIDEIILRLNPEKSDQIITTTSDAFQRAQDELAYIKANAEVVCRQIIKYDELPQTMVVILQTASDYDMDDQRIPANVITALLAIKLFITEGTNQKDCIHNVKNDSQDMALSLAASNPLGKLQGVRIQHVAQQRPFARIKGLSEIACCYAINSAKLPKAIADALQIISDLQITDCVYDNRASDALKVIYSFLTTKGS